MSQPLPDRIILPDGRTGFLNPYSGTYTTSRSYALRMQSGYRRGLPQSVARGQAPRGDTTEYTRRTYFRQQFGSRELFETTYGFSYDYWLYLRRRWIDSINAYAAPQAQITPEFIQMELSNQGVMMTFLTGGGGREWIEERLDEKLYAMEAYRAGNPEPGAMWFHSRDQFRPVEWWWYH